MITWLFWLMLMVAVVDWAASWRGWRRIRLISKPGTLMLLLAWFLQVGGINGALLWFCLGLTFSLVGDILLQMNERYFLPGAGAFFIAHLCYIIGFFQEPLALRWSIVLPLLLVAGALWLIASRLRAGMRRGGQSEMFAPTLLYLTMLSLMWFSALTTLFRPSWGTTPAVLVSLGGALFFLSDSLLLFSRFVRPLPLCDLMVLVTYHLAQIFIAGGALVQFA